ncbi:MAG: twin-arginine translocase subunit TatC [Firmicutes bacterium]|nr:twin-arginine translocase subunit TatC [Bacillota bacterium]
MPLRAHLAALRRVVLVSGAAVALCALAVFLGLSDYLLEVLLRPLRLLNVPVITIGVGEAFMARVRVSLLGGLILGFPVVAWQLGGYLWPALRGPERRLALALFPAAAVLFAGGAAFSYGVVLPLALRFLLAAAGDFHPMIALRDYVSFADALLLPGGLAFEAPLVLYLLARLNLVGAAGLKRRRRYVYLGVFILAALLTPGTDVLSQVAVAVPTVVLYEAGVVLAGLVERGRRRAAAAGARSG